jgi:hypothetical protein
MAEAVGFKVTAFSKPLAVFVPVAEEVALANDCNASQHGAIVAFTLGEVEKNNPAPSRDSRTSAEASSLLEPRVSNTPSVIVPRNFCGRSAR